MPTKHIEEIETFICDFPFDMFMNQKIQAESCLNIGLQTKSFFFTRGNSSSLQYTNSTHINVVMNWRPTWRPLSFYVRQNIYSEDSAEGSSEDTPTGERFLQIVYSMCYS
ncbi:hypothetical protein CEXT_355201 [Caerostris extrusa]|uniref:Uncharacterized protein n=1 Tax=Caerostris extrusa TaxID=172846 RepID=A0AAV4MHR3_CAEEX|nr:hypothetical protein CEXT_355201 [Caerostris extrusa]